MFKKEATEVLLEHDSPLSSFLPTVLPVMPALLAVPPIEYDPLLPMPQQMPLLSLSHDLDWGTRALKCLQFLSNLPSVVLGVSDYQLHQPAPHSTSMSSGITSTFPTLPSSHNEAIPTEIRSQTPGDRLDPLELGHPSPGIPPSSIGTNPFRSQSSCLPRQYQQESHRQSLSPEPGQHREPGLLSHAEGESEQQLLRRLRSQTSMTET